MLHMRSPLEQFEVAILKGFFHVAEFIGVPVTNYTVFVLFLLCVIILLFTLSIFDLRVIPTTSQFCIESIYNFIYNIVATNLEFDNHHFFPYIFTLFIFVLSANLLGLFPYSFTLTSQIALTFFLSFSAFIGLLITAIRDNGINFIGLFFPPEAPVALAFLLIPIEIVSFFSRPFSLAIRLFANMTAGHVLLKILAGFAIVLMSSGIAISPSFDNFLKKLVIGSIALPYAQFIYSSSVMVYFSGVHYAYQNYGAVISAFLVIDQTRYLAHFTQTLFSDGSYYFGLIDIDTLMKPEYLSYTWEVLLNKFYYFDVANLTWDTYFSTRFFYEFYGIMLTTIKKPDLAAAFSQLGSLRLYDYADLSINGVYDYMFISMNSIWLDVLNVSSLSVSLSLQFFGFFIKFAVSLFVNLVSICLPISLLCFFVILELFVSILQAYVFTILLVIYLRDLTEIH